MTIRFTDSYFNNWNCGAHHLGKWLIKLKRNKKMQCIMPRVWLIFNNYMLACLLFKKFILKINIFLVINQIEIMLNSLS